MASVEEAQAVLEALGMPPAQYNEISGRTLIALCGLTGSKSWSDATRERRTLTKGIMDYLKEHYDDMDYAPNSRETFRREVLHQFIQGGIAEKNPFELDLPTNSPHTHYAITEAALKAVRLFGSKRWQSAVRKFQKEKGALTKRYERERNYTLVPVKLPDGKKLRLSPGKHNELQKSIVESFAPRFAPGASLLYLGDTAQKDVVVDKVELERLHIPITRHSKLPDIVIHDGKRNWLFLVEAVTSHGPMSPKRIVELEEMLVDCSADPVYVSAFPNFAEFSKHLKAIAWDTEVWLADAPDHMIHYNGDRFLGPRT